MTANESLSSRVPGYLGIDNGTQGLSVIFTDEALTVLDTGEGKYDFIPNNQTGYYEQRCVDWDMALQHAMEEMRRKLSPLEPHVLSIGIAGQMHGLVMVDGKGEAIGSVRLWCDIRNEMEGEELTSLFRTKIPKRTTAARFLWTTRHHPEKAAETAHITTPAGWMAYRLTGQFVLGIGDASGMFPIDRMTSNYDTQKLQQFDKLVNNCRIPPLGQILPRVCRAGEDAGNLSERGALLLGLSYSHGAIIPVAAGEGDQVAALAGSLIGRAGTVSCSFGTSVCANTIGDREFKGVSNAVDHFFAADGQPINMVWLRNGTTFLNTIVESYGSMLPLSNNETKNDSAFKKVIAQVITAPYDCGGLLALPFMDDEPGLGVGKGGSAMVIGWNADNAKIGNVAKAALLSTMFNLQLGCEVLDRQGYPRSKVVLTGGLSKTLECAQILADVFDSPVLLMESADEGSSWGAAILAKYRHLCATVTGTIPEWTSFLESIAAEKDPTVFLPNPHAVYIYKIIFGRYRKLIALQGKLTDAVSS